VHKMNEAGRNRHDLTWALRLVPYALARLEVMAAMKRLFEPGDMVKSFTGHVGIVVSGEDFEKVRVQFKEGRRPGHFFAPGCCHNPDYVTQVPVLFEDGTYDVMRSQNIRRKTEVAGEPKEKLMNMMATGKPGVSESE
jgi:hypothetical protein